MKYLLTISVITSIYILSCKQDDEHVGSPQFALGVSNMNNLIRNPSFEFNGEANIDQWNVYSFSHFSSEAPFNGGQFSYRFTSNSPYVETYVTNIAGQKKN